MKKKYSASIKDKREWEHYTKKLKSVYNKDDDLFDKNKQTNEIKKLDLHGLSINQACKKVEEFIVESFDEGCKKLIIVTGKGLRSKVKNNPYISEKMSILKHSVPEYIKNNENLSNKINSISMAEQKDGGDGAIYVFLKNSRKFTK